ncbi:multi-sensor signal transduction histidine kinase [Nostoc sp. HK-01]|nr:multi-sensor signal transduction histidine kinase [Nostoc sp. HK-01]
MRLSNLFGKKQAHNQKLKISLRLILTVSFVILTGGTTGLVSYISLQNSQHSVNSNVADLMHRAVEGLQSIALAAEIKIFINHTNACVWASFDLIIQTLTNLLSNAIKFSPRNSEITLSTQTQAEWVLFAVKDQGRGIPADKLETIFERFQQVDISDAHAKGGTGLGLAICQSIIQQHNDSIWAESTLGEGSTFYFTLPISVKEL